MSTLSRLRKYSLGEITLILTYVQYYKVCSIHNSTMRKLICLLVSGIFCVCVQGDECPYRECSCKGSDITCIDRGLQTMPALINDNSNDITSLTLDGTNITTVPSGSLPSNLLRIFLMNTLITHIEDGAFNGSTTTLTTLTIYNGRMTRIPNAFLYLHSLQELHIEGVPILDWNIEAMKNIGSTIEILYLEFVDLTTSPTWLQYFSRLTELSIIGSYLSSLSDNAMDMMTNSLTRLSLYNNSLTEVPKALSKLTSLQTLDLSDNKISSTKWLPGSSKLVYLTLNGNCINNASQLSISLRPYANSLADLYIQQNELTSIPELSFLTLIQSINFVSNRISDPNSGSLPVGLVSIDLDHNFLPTIPRLMSSLKAVTELVLPSNALTVIRGEDFPPKATVVELGFNLLKELTDTSFPENSVIQALYMNNNPISKISPSAFKNLHELLDLSLQSTQLTRLPLALSSLVQLAYLDITHTTGIICTCQEKSLESWVLSLGPLIVRGDCGLTTIYNFFATLSPDCPT